MNDLWDRLRLLSLTARALAAATGLALLRHWLLAIFSLVLSFAIWFLVEDVENPRIEVTVPGEDQAAIPVEVVNVPEGLIVDEVAPVRVFVEAREEEVAELRAADFKAVVDAADIRADAVRSLPVVVTTERRDVRVVRPDPGTVEVSAVATVSKELPVTVVISGELPLGLRQELAAADPPFVTITGREGLVESVDQVQAVVSIAGLQSTQIFDVELIPRTSDGSRVTVTLSRNRARVTVPVEEALLTRRIAISGSVIGRPARGYAVTDVSVSPSTVEVTGPRELVEGFTVFDLGGVDVSGAIAQVIESRELSLPEGVSASVETVFLAVAIEPQRGWRVLRVIPVFQDIPEGLALEAGVYFVEARLAGSEPDLAQLSLDDVTAIVSLAEASPGVFRPEPEVTAPEGIEVVAVTPLWVQIIEAAPAEPDSGEGAESEGNGAGQ